MNNDQMRAEFEIAASERGFSLEKTYSGDYGWNSTKHCWLGFQLGYQAGRKAAEKVGCVDGCKIKRSVKEFTEGMSDERQRCDFGLD